MKDYKIDIITQIELHNVDGIRQCFEKGVVLNHLLLKKKRLEARFFELTNN